MMARALFLTHELYFRMGRRSSFKTDTLKAIVLARDLALCFAGDVLVGLEGVRWIARELENGRPLEHLLPRLQELASDSRRIVEFIAVRGDGASQLTRIRSNGIESDLPCAWIGDQHGFEQFQKERHISLDSADSSPDSHLTYPIRVMNRLRLAMQAVIEDPIIESVGHFCVAITHTPNGFQYCNSLFVHVGRDFHVEPGENIIPKMAQSVEEGGYAVSVVAPTEPGTPALGLNFPRARLGMFYLPLQFDGAQVIRDVSPNDFAKAVFDRFGIAMQDPMMLCQ